MSKEGSNAFYRAYADRWYLDRANRDTYLARQAAGDILLSGNLALPALSTLDGVDLSVHAADLDAHTRNLLKTYRTGQYITAPYGREGATQSATAGRLYTCPIFIARPMTFDAIAAWVTVASGANTSVRFGIYNDGTNHYPDSLVLDAGTVLTDATGLRGIAISQALATKGWYWAAALFESTPTVAWTRFISPLGTADITDGFSYNPSSWYVAQAYGALPASFPAAGTLWAASFILALRLLSLD